MCGLCGFIDFRTNSSSDVLNKMISTLHHRGPNDRGSDVFNYGEAIIGLGHTRLSILDISPTGHQPMHFEHLSIVFNGEIYNFNEIKNDLIKLGHNFKSHSDTEVILHAFSEWGDSCLSKFIGMFVFVIFNKVTLNVTIIMDRAGVKPLFYYWKDGLFLFASELKAFHQHPNFEKKINENVVHQYMNLGYIPSPYCIFENCAKLTSGNIITFKIPEKSFTIKKYWDINNFYRLPNLNISYKEAKKQLEKLLISAFNYRMVSDVPVGVFLSGGYDSTAVAAMLQFSRTEKIKTFTIGFEDDNNEAPYANEIAKYLGTDHTEYYCTSKEAQEIIINLPFYFDEPFSDHSAIPTILVSKLAKESVTVVLSADAGDEIFAGYTIYKKFINDLALINKIPGFSRKFFSILLKLVSKIILNEKLKSKLEVFYDLLNTDSKLIAQKLFKTYFVTTKHNKNRLFKKDYQDQTTSFDDDFTGFKDPLSIAQAIDFKIYLQNDILTKVDCATMSESIEGREPFLDHRIIEFVAQLPFKYKYGRTQKMILKDIVHKYIPKEIMDRPKSGFTPPIYSWLKTDLKYLLDENLNSNAINESGFFYSSYVEKLKTDFLNDKLSNPNIIWRLIQFQMWYKKWMTNN
jgi:asparagine synthase (glutamine-hydrolysing)